MVLKIASLEEARRIHPEFDHVISILDPGEDPGFIRSNHLIVHFEDTELGMHEDMISGVNQALDYVVDNVGLEETLLVHCRAGVSRSSAIAWAILCKGGADPRKAFERLYSEHPQIWPNTAVMNIACPEHSKLISEINAEISVRRENWQY